MTNRDLTLALIPLTTLVGCPAANGGDADHANDDGDDPQMHFSFSAPLPGDPTTEVEATVCLLGDEESRCRTNQVGGDEP